MKLSRKQVLLYLVTAVLFAGAAALNIRLLGTDVRHQDIRAIYMDGKRILNGENTYARVLDGDMRNNQKYATFFPLFYCASAITQVPFPDFGNWVRFWRVVFMMFNLGIGVSFVLYGGRHGVPWAGLFGAAIWFFNRWTITLAGIGQIDFVPILFVILSLMLFKRHRKAALYLFGLSLAVKQIAIFLGPLYLIWCWNEDGDFRSVGRDFLRIVAIPFAVSIPFLVWGAKAMILSVLFSATRNATGHFGAPSLDQVYRLVGLLAKIPMIAAMAGVFWFAYRKQLGRHAAAFLVILAFTLFNSVLFRQYMAWPTALLIPWVLAEMASRRKAQVDTLETSNTAKSQEPS